MFFSNYASQVTLLVRGPSLAEPMSSYLIEQLATRGNIAVRTQVEMPGVHGRTHLEEIDIYDRAGKATTRVGADGVSFSSAQTRTRSGYPMLSRATIAALF